MRFSVAVVSLLIPLISLTNSLNSTTNNKLTRSNGNSPIVTGEIDSSLTDISHNDTQSTAALDPSSDFALPPPQIDNRTQFEESPLSQNESVHIDSISSQFGHANRSRDKASSLNESAPIVPSSPTSSDKLQKPPQPLGSSAPNETLPGQTNENEDLSLNELKTQWELAEAAVTEWQTKVESANETLNKKVDEAVEPTRLYGERKKEWEKLEKVAVGKEADWNKIVDNATATLNEFNTANDALGVAQNSLTQAEKDLTESPEKIRLASEEFDKVKKEQELLSETTRKRTEKIGGKDALIATVGSLKADVKTKEGTLKSEERKTRLVQSRYDSANCLLPAKNTTQDCIQKLAALTRANAAVGKAQRELNSAREKLEGPDKELTDYDKDLGDMNKLIEDLTLKKLDSAFITTRDKVAYLEGQVNALQDKVTEAQSRRDLAAGEATKKELAKNEAEAMELAGPSSDVTSARDAADNAKLDLEEAEVAKTEIDGKVNELRNELAKATESYTKVKATAASWKNRYETAERKQRDAEARRSASTAAMIGGVVGGVFAAIVIVAILVVCFLKRLCCFKKLKKGGPPAPKPDDSKIKSGTPSTGNSKDQPSKKIVPGSNPASGRQLKVVPAGTQPLGPDEIPSTPIPPPTPTGPQEPPGLPDLRTTPFVPGEEPFKIPAKHFKWKGPMRRRTRWHGEPKHDFENDQGVSHIDKIWFDPNANFATEIGANEIMEDGGPASDSNRSEWLNNLDEWEAGHAAMLREQQQQQPAAGSAPAAAAPPLPPAPLPSLRFGRHTRLEAPSTPEGARTARVTDRVRDFRRNEIKVQTPPTSKNKQHK